jgi:hypothetical protein
MRFVFQDTTPSEAGVRGRAFGIGNDDSIADSLRAQGFEQGHVGRLDSRHEFALPRAWGIFKIVPFLVGRYTTYTDDFDEFSSDAGSTRAYGAAGVRIHTSFQRVNDSVESRLLDLHRMRHIVEPSVILWYAQTDRDAEDLPSYDPAVEPLTSGAAVRVGLSNRWQTQRGGPGRWRSVDWLTLDTAVVLHSDDADVQSPSPQFFDYRPEYSQPGDHFDASAVLALTDSVTIGGRQVLDLDASRLARASIGGEVQHSPVLSTFAEYRFLDAGDDQILDAGWNYQLTPVYRVTLGPQWDFRQDDFRSLSVRVVRRFPEVDLIVRVVYDQIKGETAVGASLELVEF